MGGEKLLDIISNSNAVVWLMMSGVYGIILAIDGIVCLILAGTKLVDSLTGLMRVSLSVLILDAVATSPVVGVLVRRIVQAQRKRQPAGLLGHYTRRIALR